eukprot:g26324.t1
MRRRQCTRDGNRSPWASSEKLLGFSWLIHKAPPTHCMLFGGFLLLQSRYASHMALLAAVWRMSSLFPRVRIEFDIEREDGPRDLLNVAEATCCS